MATFKEFNVLIADDEDDLRDTIVFDFRRKGFNVFSARNGAEALEVVLANKIHLVISDIRMPGGDGVTLLEKIRAHDPKIPTVILVTGHADASEAECLAKGALRVFTKPFDRKALMSSVCDALGITTGKAA